MVKVGDHIRIVYMVGEPQYTGKEGVVTHIDDAGQIHGTWGGCAILPGEDEIEIIAAQAQWSLLCPSGGIGRRGRLKPGWSNPCGFESHLGHQIKKENLKILKKFVIIYM